MPRPANPAATPAASPGTPPPIEAARFAGQAPPATVDVLAAAITAMASTLDVARALVAAGRSVDLDGLDAEMTALCAAVLTLGPSAGRPLRPGLEDLLVQADGLAASLRPP